MCDEYGVHKGRSKNDTIDYVIAAAIDRRDFGWPLLRKEENPSTKCPENVRSRVTPGLSSSSKDILAPNSTLQGGSSSTSLPASKAQDKEILVDPTQDPKQDAIAELALLNAAGNGINLNQSLGSMDLKNATIHVAGFAITKFRAYLQQFPKSKEQRCCWLFGCAEEYGKPKRMVLRVTHSFVPMQIGSAWKDVNISEHSNVVDFQEKYKVELLGWMYAHPGFRNCLSCRALHTQYAHQNSFEHLSGPWNDFFFRILHPRFVLNGVVRWVYL